MNYKYIFLSIITILSLSKIEGNVPSSPLIPSTVNEIISQTFHKTLEKTQKNFQKNYFSCVEDQNYLENYSKSLIKVFGPHIISTIYNCLETEKFHFTNLKEDRLSSLRFALLKKFAVNLKTKEILYDIGTFQLAFLPGGLQVLLDKNLPKNLLFLKYFFLTLGVSTSIAFTLCEISALFDEQLWYIYSLEKTITVIDELLIFCKKEQEKLQ